MGLHGAILSSLDGLDWQAESSGVAVDLTSVAASRSLLVAVGAGGTVLTSTGGSHWTSRDAGTDDDLAHVIFTGEQFVAVGGAWSDGAVVLTSSDGATWSRIEAPPEYSFHTVANARGTIYAAAVTPSTKLPMALDNVVLASVPPSTSNRGGWIPHRELPRFHDSLSLLGETLLVGNWNSEATLSRSSDGEKWSTQTLPVTEADAIAAAPDGSAFVIMGGTTALHSSDGVEWTAEPLPFEQARRLMAVAYGASRFVAVGLDGAMFSSPSGATWTPQSAAVGFSLTDVVFTPSAAD